MTPSTTRLSLARTLVARELRPSAAAIGLLFAIAAAAAALGRHVTALVPDRLAVAGASPLLLASIGDQFAWALAEGLPVPFAIGAAWLVIDRIRTDEADGWLAPLAAGGASRATYLLGVTAGVVVAVTAAFLVALAAFAVGVATLGGDRDAALEPLAGGPPLLLAAAAYAAACATLAPRRALPLALTGVLVPLAIVTGGVLDGYQLSQVVTRLLVLHLPLFSTSPAPDVVARHTLYAVLLLALTTIAADRRLGRCT